MRLEALLDMNIAEFGEYPMLYFGNRQITNVQTREFADQFASGLRSCGITSEDRVMVCMPNCPEVLFSYQGITRAGAIVVPVMFTLHAKEIRFILANSGAKAIITSSILLNKVKESLVDLPIQPLIIVVDQPSGDDIYNFYDVCTKQNNEIRDLSGNSDDVAIILYTSGTTGNPKGVQLTHKNLYSNATNSAKHNETERGTTIGVLPLAHVYGLTMSNICYITGSSVVIFPKFDPKDIFEAIEKYKVRSFSAVPAMIHALVSYPGNDLYDTSTLEWVGSGSAPLPVALLHAFERRFGAKIFEGYGLSEAAPIVTAHRKGIEIKPGSVGIPIPGVEIKIVDEFGQAVKTGEVGELIVRGENITPGYYKNEEESNKVLKDSWLFTGDMAKLDAQGYLYIVDRKKDLVIRGGFNVYPRDIEEVLNGHESIFEAAVVGIPDERMGEELVACIVKKPGSELLEAQVIQYCQQHLAKNKTPRRVIFMEALPRNGVGKILKTHLRKSAAEVVM